VTAEDLAGNTITRTFTYLPGRNLSIRFLSCHPNPFSLRARGVNGPPQKVRFAFELTDNASQVDLGIYSVTGRKIMSFSFTDLNGYNEIPWDGRDRDGYRIANGTYYLKLTARNSRRTATKKIKIAKLEGY
jgi:flagellar hook assembly protein FlgD